MSNHPLLGARMQGVRIPENQSTEQAPTMKVTNVAVLQPVLLEWGNERGIKQTSIGFVCGSKVYLPPQYQLWTDGFKPLVEVLGKQVIEALEIAKGSTSPIVPTEDAVSVVDLDHPPQTDDSSALIDVFEKGK